MRALPEVDVARTDTEAHLRVGRTTVGTIVPRVVARASAESCRRPRWHPRWCVRRPPGSSAGGRRAPLGRARVMARAPQLLAASGTNVALLAALAVALATAAGLGLTGRMVLALAAVAAYVPLAGG